jgi:hypothetical protein
LLPKRYVVGGNSSNQEFVEYVCKRFAKYVRVDR